ncbi:uncharacterized protein LOC131802777 [Musca domestica]|uniref:Regulatory protein zeste n=1 Tax=Musca domestica TaxID=7370 RepID=A0ABM3UME5_MUSDO|nr:uncharacterized protein LOC131800865 [Musca domestica]XP_058979359.1 uncharacterized protein LOC131802777 [Musca domestica]
MKGTIESETSVFTFSQSTLFRFYAIMKIESKKFSVEKYFFIQIFFMKMEKSVRGKRASEEQKEFLINFLEENVDLANDKFCTVDGAKYREEKWKELAECLNAIGGTMKDGAKWRKYWSDLRQHTRSKYLLMKRDEQKSGINGPKKIKQLSEVEQRIINITKIEAVDGDKTQEMGFLCSPGVHVENNSSDICYQEDMVEILDDQIVELDEDLETGENSTFTIKLGGKRPRKEKRKVALYPDESQFEILFKIEEEKVEAMRKSNTLKEREIEAIKEQTEAIKADTQAKVDFLKRIQEVIQVLPCNNNGY